MKIFKNIFLLFFLYLFIRVTSFFAPPETTLQNGSFFNSLISIAILIVTSYLIIKKNDYAWYIIAAEIILGGSGNFFSVFEISLRTLLLVSSLALFVLSKPLNETILSLCEHTFFLKILIVLYFIVATSAIRGFYFGHSASQIFADTIPYLFLLYYFPFSEIFKKEKFRNFITQSLIAALIGNLTLIFFTFIGFSLQLFHPQDAYYHWFRDVANGKITDLGYNFYRIVINEHLLLIPLFLLFFNRLLSQDVKEYKKYFQISCLLILGLLAISLTRIYLIALIIGLVLSFSTINYKKWILFCTLSLFTFILIFVGMHTAASRGKSLGLELFGLRIQSIAAPDIEDSSLSRKILLPKILEKIKKRPLLGNGLGDTVTIFSPVVKKEITTSEFDWGYFEIIDELGIVGFITWLILISGLIMQIKKIPKISLHPGPSAFFLIPLISLLVINITSPALFHVFGIILITIFYLETQNQPRLINNASLK